MPDASRAAILKAIRFCAWTGSVYVRFDSVPDIVIHTFCGALFEPAKQRRCW
jgi:hypothetical protein